MHEDPWKRMREVLKARPQITPDDLAPFGARVTTTTGHIAEILGWFGPNPKEIPPYGNERVVIAIIVDGVTRPLPEGKKMFMGWFAESMIVDFAPQRFPKFGPWILDVALFSATGKGSSEA